MSTTMNLNAELYRQLACVAGDESTMKKILKYVKALVAKSEEKKNSEEIAKANILNGLRESIIDLKDALDGKEDRFISEDDFENELRREGYYD